MEELTPHRERKPKETTPHEPTKWEKYAKGKKPSMKRRCNLNDYLDRGIYMITMTIQDRHPLLGKLEGEDQASAHVVLSAFGERVKQCWESIPLYHKEIEVMKLCVMPDHIHGILFVHERMNKHLGQVINGFKIGCRKAARELGIITAALPQYTQQTQHASPSSVQYTAALPQSAPTTPTPTTPAPTTPTPTTPAPTTQSPPSAPATPTPPRAASHPNGHGTIWEENYHDRILRGRGQLQRMLQYMDDNPGRLLIKRQHPDYFTNHGTLTVAGIPMQAMGNRFLLDNPVKIQIQCSRRMTPKEIEHYTQATLYKANKEGAIVVSPCISPGEQHTATAAMTAGIPLIVLLLNGFPPYFKPKPRYLKACEEGRLLMLAPYPYQNEKIENMRARCLQLNDITARICCN